MNRSINNVSARVKFLSANKEIICLLKSAVSHVHLVTASQNMAALDAAERDKSANAHRQSSECKLQGQQSPVLFLFVSMETLDVELM